MNKLICINQDDNMNNLLAILYYKPKEILVIKNKYSNLKTLDHFVNFLQTEGYKVPVVSIDLTDPTVATNIELHIPNNSNSLFILPSDSTVIGYQLMINLVAQGAFMAYVEDDGDIFELQKNQFKFVSNSSLVEVEDYIHSRGGVITSDTTILFGHPRIKDLLFFIEDNFNDYKELFRYASKKTPFYKSYPDNKNKLILTPTNLSLSQQKFLDKLLIFMESHDIIKVNQRLKNRFIISFKHKSYKSYLLKTGTWLEHRLYLLMLEAGADQVEASLTFLWDKKRKANNEIDVIGIKNNHLIVASCKDRSRIDPEYINEVYTNAIHLGNKEAIKLLFTTAEVSFGLKEKATEFGVHIIRYNFNNSKTIKALKSIIS